MVSSTSGMWAEIQKLHVAEVIRYLQKHHWMSVSHPSPRLLVFEKGVDDSAQRTLRERDNPIQIVLPSKDDYEDTPYLLAKAVNLLSVLESVSFQEIVNAFAERLETRIDAFVPAS